MTKSGGRGKATKKPARKGRVTGGKPGAKPAGRARPATTGGRRLDRTKSGGDERPARAGGKVSKRDGATAERDGSPARGQRAEAPRKRRSPPQAATPTQGGAHFIDSVTSPDAVPEGPPEFAFVGRSNVGKSSLLNALSRHKSLARTSKTPGRTQRVNLFDVPLRGGLVLRFADLPGYGHAKVPGAIRKTFGPMIEGYLLGRESLLAVCVLVDARRDPDEDTISFVLWLHEHNIRVELVVTKLDKIAKTKRLNVLERLRKAHAMRRHPWATSTLSGDGVDTLRGHLRRLASAAPRRRA